jgi:putative membrane protein
MTRISTLGFALALLALAAGAAEAHEQPKSAVAMCSKADSAWSPVDYNFVAQANLGAPFQIASGRIAEEKATTANIRDYATSW